MNLKGIQHTFSFELVFRLKADLFKSHNNPTSTFQSYEIKLPSQAFLDGRSSPWRKLREVGCYDVAKFRLVTIDSCALIHSCLLFTNLNFATS